MPRAANPMNADWPGTISMFIGTFGVSGLVALLALTAMLVLGVVGIAVIFLVRRFSNGGVRVVGEAGQVMARIAATQEAHTIILRAECQRLGDAIERTSERTERGLMDEIRRVERALSPRRS